MAKKNTEITPDMPMDVYLMEVIAPSITTIKDDLHELKEKLKSLEEHHSSSLSSSGTDDLAENVADKVVSKMQTQQMAQTEQKNDVQNTAGILQSAAREGIRKEITPMLQSIGNVNTKVESAISSIESLTKKWLTCILRLFKIYFNKVDGMFSLRLNGVVRGYILRS